MRFQDFFRKENSKSSQIQMFPDFSRKNQKTWIFQTFPERYEPCLETITMYITILNHQEQNTKKSKSQFPCLVVPILKLWKPERLSIFTHFLLFPGYFNLTRKISRTNGFLCELFVNPFRSNCGRILQSTESNGDMGAKLIKLFW